MNKKDIRLFNQSDNKLKLDHKNLVSSRLDKNKLKTNELSNEYELFFILLINCNDYSYKLN